MEAFRAIGKVLMIPAILMLVWDIGQWVVTHRIKIRSFHEWGEYMIPGSYPSVMAGLHKILPPEIVSQIDKLPGCAVIFVPAFVLYFIGLAASLLSKGKSAGDGSYVYKSRH